MIINLLVTNPRAVERAIVAIYNNQTISEQVSERTQFRNGRGFNKVHDRYGSYLARWIISGGTLSQEHLNKARQMAIFYSKQLVEIANGR